MPIEEGSSSKPETIIVVGVSGVGLDGESSPGAERTFFEGERLITIDSDRCLCYLLRNSTLKLVVIYYYSSSSQIIGGTSKFIPISTLSVEDEKDERDKKEDENRVVGGEVLAFWTGQVVSFFFWVGRRTAELDAGRLAIGACLSVPSWCFFSCSSKRA